MLSCSRTSFGGFEFQQYQPKERKAQEKKLQTKKKKKRQAIRIFDYGVLLITVFSRVIVEDKNI